jgi:[ribosomal protein S18]-alanine N-acetyltransferase
MKVPFLNMDSRDFFTSRDFFVEPLEARDTGAVSMLHQEDFHRPWSDVEFQSLLSQDTVFGFVVREIGRGESAPAGFVLARLAAGEGEILTVAVSRARRRLGLGWKLMDAVLRELHSARADALFLEVDETNLGAIALYRRLGFGEVGKRPAYYEHGGGPRTGALVMRRQMRKPA